MARNTGPVTPAPRWPEPPQGQAAPRHDQGFGQGQPGYPVDPRHYPPAPGAGQPAHHQQQHQPQAPHYPDPGYADPAGYDQGAYDPYQQPQHGAPLDGYGAPQAPQAPQHAAYAPQFEPYQPQPPQAAAQWPPSGHAAPVSPPYPQQQPGPAHDGGYYGEPPGYRARDARMAAPEPAYRPPAPQLRGPAYDQNPGWPAPAADPYVPQPGWGGQQGYDDGGHGYAPADPYGYGGAPQAPAYGAGDYAAQHYAPDDQGFGAAEAPYLPPQHHQEQAVAADYDPEEVAYEDDERGGRGRFVKIAAAVVVAVGLGGGLAYGYKSFFGGDKSGKPPVVRTEATPSKEKPADPGGKKFAHTDSKILGRLSDGGEKPAAGPSGGASTQSDSSDPSGTRKVSTMIIGRDGSIVDSAPSQPPPQALPPTASPVPGMTIVDGFGARRPPAVATSVQPPASPPPSEPVKAQVAAPQKAATAAKPIVISKAEPEVAEEAPAKAEVPKALAKQKVAKAVTGTASEATATTAATSGAGYVAVLASIPSSASSRMEALKQFADLQQKYVGQLGSKTPDVQEANLGTKGNFHRLVVGPPGSRQQATQLCSDLKAAGYASCWVKSY